MKLEYFPTMKTPDATEAERDAVQWMRVNFGRIWKARLRTTPDMLRPENRHFYWHPFGREDWNEIIATARAYLWRVENLGPIPQEQQ